MTAKNSTKMLLTISETSDELDLPSHVLRFWEKQFPQIKPTRHNNRRYYTVDNIKLIVKIKDLLYTQGFTIEGAKKELKNTNQSTAPTTKPLDFKSELLSIRKRLKDISTLLSNNNLT